MSDTPTRDERLVRYLVGRAAEEERAEIEERLFADDAFEEELYATADDVMDEYLGGRLAPPERVFFEERFLTVARHRTRLEFLRQLRRALPPPPPRSRPWLPWVAAAGTAAAALGAVWLSSRPAVAPGPGPQVARATATPVPPAAPPVAPATGTELRRPAASRRAAHPTGVRALSLPRTAAVADVALAPDTDRVRIAVDVDPDAPSFDAVLRTQDGVEVWRAAGLMPPAGERLVLEVPARVLEFPRYALLIEPESLRGSVRSPAVEYTLRIRRLP